MICYSISAKVNRYISCSINHFYFLPNVMVWRTVIMPVRMQLDMAVFHHLNLKIFLQFPVILRKGSKLPFFLILKKHIAAFCSALKGNIIMLFKIFSNSIIESVKVCEHLVTKRGINPGVNNLNHPLYPCFIPWLKTAGRKYCHTIMIAKVQKIPVDICLIRIGFVYAGLEIIRYKYPWNSSKII